MKQNLKLKKLDPAEQQKAKKRFNDGERLNDIVPFTATNGIRVTSINCLCSVCAKPIDAEFVSVIEKKVFTTQIFECIGVCRGCRCMTECIFRFHESGYADTLSGYVWRPLSLSTPKNENKSYTLKWWDLVGRFQSWINVFSHKNGKNQ